MVKRKTLYLLMVLVAGCGIGGGPESVPTDSVGRRLDRIDSLVALAAHRYNAQEWQADALTSQRQATVRTNPVFYDNYARLTDSYLKGDSMWSRFHLRFSTDVDLKMPAGISIEDRYWTGAIVFRIDSLWAGNIQDGEDGFEPVTRGSGQLLELINGNE